MQISRVRVRVIYADVDRMGVVHHAIYLRYFEHARTEYLRLRGVSYAEVEDTGYMMPIVDVGIRYHKPARYDDLLCIVTKLGEIRAATVRFDYEVVRDAQPEAVLLSGHTVLACCNRDGRPVRMPPELRALLVRDEIEAPG